MSYRWAVLAAGTPRRRRFSTVSFAIAVLAPALRDEYGLSLTEIGVVLAAEWIGLTFALLPWGFAVDRFGERWTLAAGLAVCAGLPRRGGVRAELRLARRSSSASPGSPAAASSRAAAAR